MANLLDSANYPTNEPDVLTAGDFWAWKRQDLNDYPAASYALTYTMQLEGTGATKISLTATESGNDYIIEVSGSVTNNYTAGDYVWSAYITDSSDSTKRIEVDTALLKVELNKAKSSNEADPRSHAKKVLDAIEAIIEGRASTDQQSYSLAGRSITKLSIDDLFKLRDRYKVLVMEEKRRDRIKNGKKTGRYLLTSFNNV